MKKVHWILVFGIIISTLGCAETKEEFSEPMSEMATVASVVYTPSFHDTELNLSAGTLGGGGELMGNSMNTYSGNSRSRRMTNQGSLLDLFGVDYNGNVGLNVGGGMQLSSVEVPEKWAVAFNCQHGGFINDKKWVYDKLVGHEGQTVKVNYREVYRVTYDTPEGETEKRAVSRVLVKYDFLCVELQ